MAYSPSGFVETADETFILHMQKIRKGRNEQSVQSLSTSRSEGQEIEMYLQNWNFKKIVVVR